VAPSVASLLLPQEPEEESAYHSIPSEPTRAGVDECTTARRVLDLLRADWRTTGRWGRELRQGRGHPTGTTHGRVPCNLLSAANRWDQGLQRQERTVCEHPRYRRAANHRGPVPRGHRDEDRRNNADNTSARW